MSALQEFSGAQQFFLVFVLLSSPVFLYFYLRATLGRARPKPHTAELSQFPLSSGLPATDAEAPSLRESIAEPVGNVEPAQDHRDGMFPRGTFPAPYDIVILPLRQRPSAAGEAGFPAKPRYQVLGGHSFQIVLEVKGLLTPQELAEEMDSPEDDEESGLLIAEIVEGETVGLTLECLPSSEDAQGDSQPIDIDSTYQAFSLGSRPVTAIFMAHARPVETETSAAMSLRIMAGGVAAGRIDFEITVYPPVTPPV
ncbi:MAG: hypothetical protein WCD20_17755 [Rhodomicrobium sp.]